QPGPGQTFIGWAWDGRPAGWASPLAVAIDASHTLAATFVATPSFPDVLAGQPYTEAITPLKAPGIVKGYGDGTFGPDDTTPRDLVLRVQVLSFITRAMVDAHYWTQQPVDPGLYGGVLNGTGHEADVATFIHYTQAFGGVPGYPATGGFPGWDALATRGWFAQ